ncbi:hypothetical protein [Clostridium sp. JN-9]|uniref:hypothetical protein n=1 Tax=Clostridium sp. JN-9 TaxID=2507159 RepID=UPI000FFE04F1|nr:hypothetical protein [Clostridium sp. JN-9]QAT40811.1 hypothetical protein EQM05_11375 [Clostridium sp. JN-9]
MKIEIICCNNKLNNLKKRYCTRKNVRILRDITSITIGLCITFGCTHVLAADPSAIDVSIAKADKMGRTIWKILLSIGYWAAAIYATKDMIADMSNSDVKEVVKTGVKYLIGYACIFFFVDFLDLIRSFGK